MMALKSGPSSADSSAISSRTMIAKAHMRRRRSKGAIARVGGSDDQSSQASSTDKLKNGEKTLPAQNATKSMPPSNSVPPSTQTQNTSSGESASQAPAKPCHYARMALLACRNAIRMGARTQLSLCPPGRARRGLQAALRQRARGSLSAQARKSLQGTPETGGYFGLDKFTGSETLEEYAVQEEDYLLSTNTFDVESDEEASSGDDDEINNIDLLLSEEAPPLDDPSKYDALDEPLFTPLGGEASLLSPNGGPLNSLGNGGSGKLPFNHRKLRLFDIVSAHDRTLARKYLMQEIRRSKQREAMLLSRHLQKMQREERNKRVKDGNEEKNDDWSDQESDSGSVQELMNAGVSKFDGPMTPAMAASLMAESLALNPVESIEGMGKCYEGIVAAGVALLDASTKDPTSPLAEDTRPVATRSEIMAALTPLLITSLEQPSGDVILSLARLRRMCGTARYQRRFVQRIAPALIRPPRAAIWCLRHQNDMEPIIAAAELIFDSATETFSKGWYERGRMILADSKRAETLNSAAVQLRNLSTDAGDSLTLGLPGHGHGKWRGKKLIAGGHGKDGSKSSNEQLTEWEVIAVDRQMRISISSIMTTDWSRPVVSNEITRTSSYHRSRNVSSRSRNTVLSSTSVEMSPRATTASPMSPARPVSSRAPASPPGQSTPSQSPSVSMAEAGEVKKTSAQVTALSKTASRDEVTVDLKKVAMPVDELAGKQSDHGTTQSGSHTPPRSPRREVLPEPKTETPVPATAPAVAPASPRSKVASQAVVKESISSGVGATTSPVNVHGDRAPLSPSGVVTSGSTGDLVPHRPGSSASSVASSGSNQSQPAHYRMLTSTAAERKRTVAACRALRAQITRFEDAFTQLHGRPPKGATERAPLATTYAQYREWKRAIRADAACRIQALFRGASTRWRLLRSNNAKLSIVVAKRAGRARQGRTAGGNLATEQSDMLQKLSIPAEIGEASMQQDNASVTSIQSASSSGTARQADELSQSSNSIPPQWGNQIVRRRSGNGESFAGPPSANSFPRSPSSTVASAISIAELANLSLPELQARKKELKQQLKQYDVAFARRHGRMPVKAEKEPIRHLYETYNALKNQITAMERDGRHLSSPAAATASPVLTQRTVSPTSGPESGDEESSASRSRRTTISRSPPFAQPGSPSSALSNSQDLATLRAEKGRLHQMLRSYERDFFREHNRQVSSFADIRPVASQYRRYKEIKRAIAALQSGADNLRS